MEKTAFQLRRKSKNDQYNTIYNTIQYKRLSSGKDPTTLKNIKLLKTMTYTHLTTKKRKEHTQN